MSVEDLAARFSDAVNRRAPDDLAALFTPDGRWVVPGLPDTVGRPAVAALFRGLLDRYAMLVQLTQGGVVTLAPDGRGATARWYLTEHVREPDGTGWLFLGWYDDELALTEEGWRFAVREFAFLYRGRRELPGRVYPPPANSPSPLDR